MKRRAPPVNKMAGALITVSDDDLRHVPIEQAALMLGWSLRTVERRSADGSGPRITRTGPRSRSMQLGRIREFLAKCERASA